MTMLLLSGVLLGSVACTVHDKASSRPDSPTESSTTAGVISAPWTSSDNTSSPAPVGLEPLPVSAEPFVSNAQWPACVHPGVVTECHEGWCRIPAGCYVFGTPEGTPGRAAVGEEQGPVTFTYDMEVMQTELTWAEYDRITGWPRNITENACAEDACPAYVSWWEAMLLANLLSETHDPPLEKCYEVEDTCTREPGMKMLCSDFKLTVPGYSCSGYRLPNMFEWQYLARGGTTTDFYTGNMLDSNSLDCMADPALEKIAWYCGNSEGPGAKPVGSKLPNRWGLYDLHGNMYELLQTLNFRAPGEPVTDPAEPDASGERLTDIAGGNAVSYPRAMQVARRIDSNAAAVRLVRTLGKGTLPQLP